MISVDKRNVLMAVTVGIVLLVAGAVFVEENPWLGYTESAIVYLAAVIGAGFCWLGSRRDK